MAHRSPIPEGGKKTFPSVFGGRENYFLRKLGSFRQFYGKGLINRKRRLPKTFGRGWLGNPLFKEGWKEGG